MHLVFPLTFPLKRWQPDLFVFISLVLFLQLLLLGVLQYFHIFSLILPWKSFYLLHNTCVLFCSMMIAPSLGFINSGNECFLVFISLIYYTCPLHLCHLVFQTWSISLFLFLMVFLSLVYSLYRFLALSAISSPSSWSLFHWSSASLISPSVESTCRHLCFLPLRCFVLKSSHVPIFSYFFLTASACLKNQLVEFCSLNSSLDFFQFWVFM